MAPADGQRTGLMRNLGRFFGHIVAGAKSDPACREVSREVEEERLDTPDGPVTLRRTVIEEIEFDHKADGGREANGTGGRS